MGKINVWIVGVVQGFIDQVVCLVISGIEYIFVVDCEMFVIEFI